MNVKLILEYDGSRYHGWQAQSGAPTIEAELRTAIAGFTGETPSLTAAGRTDAGVHALGQVVNFNLEGEFPVEQLPGAINARLPRDIAVRSAEIVAENFNARYSALARLYAYRIRQGLSREAYQRQYAWGLKDTLDLAAMQAAADRLEGQHDFRAFGRSPRPGDVRIARASPSFLSLWDGPPDRRRAG